MSNLKTKEGDSLVDQAKKHLSTGFFKWHPDYDSAASCFQKAAVAYKNGRDLEKSCDAYIKLADCQYKNGFRFHAAKAYEDAAHVYKDMKDLGKAMANFDHAAELYLEDGTPDTAAMCLDKAGKIAQTTHPEWAIASYMKAAEIYENEDQNRFRAAAELVGKVARLQVGLQKYTEAIKSIAHQKKLMNEAEGSDHGAGAKLTCALVLLHLTNGDQVRAEQSIYDACENVSGFDEGEEYDALQKLIEAYDERKQDKASQILNAPLFKYMDTAYAKLARSLRVPGYIDSNKTVTMSGNVASGGKQTPDDVEQLAQDMSNIQSSMSGDMSNASVQNKATSSRNISPEDDIDLC